MALKRKLDAQWTMQYQPVETETDQQRRQRIIGEYFDLKRFCSLLRLPRYDTDIKLNLLKMYFERFVECPYAPIQLSTLQVVAKIQLTLSSDDVNMKESLLNELYVVLCHHCSEEYMTSTYGCDIFAF